MKKYKISKMLGLLPFALLAIGLFVYLMSVVFNHIEISLIISAVIVVCIVLILMIINGTFGKITLSRKLGKNKQGEWYIVDNVNVYTRDKKPSEINHIVINKYGVWLIIVRNYKGKIYGSDYEKMWTQITGINQIREKIPSPVIQNNINISLLKERIGDAPCHSVIVFLRGDISYIESKYVIKPKEISDVITKGDEILSEKNMQDYYDKIIDMKDDSLVEYYENIKNVKKQEEQVDTTLKCPKCGKPLLISSDENGEPMYMCSDYPNCTYIK